MSNDQLFEEMAAHVQEPVESHGQEVVKCELKSKITCLLNEQKEIIKNNTDNGKKYL